MVRKTKNQKTRAANGRKGGRPKTKPDPSGSESDESEAYEPPTKKARVFINGPSAFLLTVGVLQSILYESTRCTCDRPEYKVDIMSYKGFNTHLGLFCRCGKEKDIWTGPENLNESILMGAK